MFHKEVKPSQKDSDPIKHVVYLMLENRSFDHVLGSLQAVHPDLNGIDPKAPRFNPDDKDNPVYQEPITETQILLDPNHENSNVIKQMANSNNGFVTDFISTYPKSTLEERKKVMGYYPIDSLPATHALAKAYKVCDEYYSSVPGPTWPNRFFSLSGTSNGRVKMPRGIADPNAIQELFYQNQPTIFDRLDEQNISWRTYVSDVPISLAFTNQRRLQNLVKYRPIACFFKDATGPEKSFPAFSYIEPGYLLQQNDDHPPHDSARAQYLLRDVYNVLRSNELLWKSTLLIVNYDEHGGFYDHVQPPVAVAPDSHTEEYTFTRYGVRVPAILVSPWVKPGVLHTQFDHTSVLRYLSDKWKLGPLGERTRQANSIGVAFNFEEGPREDCPTHIHIPDKKLVAPALGTSAEETQSHLALHSLATFLQHTRTSETNSRRARRSCCDTLKEKIGNTLLSCGMWMKKNSDKYREDRTAETCAIIRNFIGTEEEQKEIETKLSSIRIDSLPEISSSLLSTIPLTVELEGKEEKLSSLSMATSSSSGASLASTTLSSVPALPYTRHSLLAPISLPLASSSGSSVPSMTTSLSIRHGS